MKRTARKIAPDADQPLLFSDRPTLAERIVSGELIDLGHVASAHGFRWPLAVSATLYRDVETIPRGCAGSEVVSRRWKHVLLLTAPAAAQLLRDRRAEGRINVVLRTSAEPEKSREHLKALCLTVERDPEGRASFGLGYCAQK